MTKPVQPIPSKFVYEQVGFGVSSKIELIKGTFYKTPKFEQTALKLGQPSLEKWITFGYFLEQLHAWDWKPRYINSSVMDGTKWSLNIEYMDDRVITSSGSNAYPSILDAEYQGGPKGSLDWELFQVSLEWLTKRKD